MIDTSDPTVAALLAACVENPDDLTAALVLADAIEAAEGGVPCPECKLSDRPGRVWSPNYDGWTTGDRFYQQCMQCRGSGWLPHPRAEFIRVCCELESEFPHVARDPAHVPARWGRSAEYMDLLSRRDALLQQHERAWRSAGKCPECGGTGDSTPSSFDGCRRCFRTGDAGGLLIENASGEFLRPVRWRRGLIDRVEVPRLEGCFERGVVYEDAVSVHMGQVPTPWLRAVVTHHPTVREVVPLDREPARASGGPHEWYKDNARGMVSETPYHLFDPVYDALEGGTELTTASLDDATVFRCRRYPDREAAASALGRAVVTAARG